MYPLFHHFTKPHLYRIFSCWKHFYIYVQNKAQMCFKFHHQEIARQYWQDICHRSACLLPSSRIRPTRNTFNITKFRCKISATNIAFLITVVWDAWASAERCQLEFFHYSLDVGTEFLKLLFVSFYARMILIKFRKPPLILKFVCSVLGSFISVTDRPTDRFINRGFLG